MSSIIQALEAEQMDGKVIPDFESGDTIVVKVRVKEGTRERLQAFEGVLIAKRTRGLNSSFTVRKLSHGEGVERVFQTFSPQIDSIEVKRRGKVRRAKLYYMRGRTGKAARIQEKLNTKPRAKNVAKAPKAEAKAPKAAATETSASTDEQAKE